MKTPDDAKKGTAMIYDTKSNLARYKGLSPALDRALDALGQTDFSQMTEGKYPVDGDNVVFLVQVPETRSREQSRWEAHENYIDIQYLVDGVERIGFQPAGALRISEPYNGEKDIVFYEDNGKGFFVGLEPDSFVVCFPTDAHMPLVSEGKPERIKKVVVKVKADPAAF